MWVAPALFGLMLIAFGVLVWYRPEILAYLVSAAFIFSGTSIFLFALTSRMTMAQRTDVHYRRLDEDQFQ